MFFSRPGIFPAKPAPPLPHLTTPSATELAAKAKSPPAAQALLKPGMSSSEYVHALEQHKMPLDAVHALAHGMPERHAVWWAAQSSQKVAGKLNPQELAANQAAEAWVKNPTAANQAAAAAAAGKTDFKGPGGWAAQAAAWSKPPVPQAPAVGGAAPALNAPNAPKPPALAPAAVAGAVLLAAGLSSRPAMSLPQKPDLKLPKLAVPKVAAPKIEAPKVAAPKIAAPAVTPPAVPAVDQTKLVQPLHPFTALGKDIASGKNTWS